MTPSRPSRYAIVGDTVFRHPTGRVVRPVLHAATARVFLADPDTAGRLAGEPPSETAGADHDRLLADAGLLVAEDADEPAAIIAAGRAASRDARIRNFVVMPSAYCNMGCGYCGQTHERVTVSGSHREVLAARFDRAANSGRYDALTVRWFGGEPLMAFAVLRDLSDRFIASADAAGVRYAAKVVTNGALLDARKLRALHRARVGTIEVTLDGPAEVHDASRPLKSGGGSFARITAVIAAALDDAEVDGLQFVIRTNVGVHNAGLAEPFSAALADAGLAHDRVHCYPAPVHAWGNDVTDVALARREMAATEMAWLRAYRKFGLRSALLPTARKDVVCVATTRHSEVVAPDGRLYSCTEQPLVPGVSDAHLGRLAEHGPDELRPAGAFDDWYDTVEAGETPCRSCAILPLCGGACPKLWREGQSPCPPLRDNIRQRLDLYAIDAGCVPA
ncbi:radical SAM protein [Actinoplanes sp. NPDC051346]|uniref:radical SAM/SPASM domain-containing protein n=1 Tax=Actinoplanes sp. NPDC051346 TaxID=3155048 RepID=UPI00341C3786